MRPSTSSLMRKRARVVPILASLLLSCFPASPAPPSPTETPVPGGRIVEPIDPDITTLQPILTSDSASSRATQLLYEPLVRADPTSGEPRPHLGEWQISADGLTYSWRIAPNAVWSDGAPVVAADWLTGVKAVAKSKKTGRKVDYEIVQGFREFADGASDQISGVTLDAADPKRMTVRLGRSHCPALSRPFGSNFLLPTHVFGRYVTASSSDEIDRAPENEEPRVTNGPFVLREWRKRDELVLVRNERYWLGAPLLDGYTFKFVSRQQVPDLFKAGAINYAAELPSEFVADIAPDIERAGLRIERTLSTSYTYIGWNTQSATAPALRDKRIRQALAYGLDGDLVIAQVYAAASARMLSHHPPGYWAQASGLVPYAYDRAKAEQLVQAAGYARGPDGVYQRSGVPLTFSIVTNEDNPKRLALLQLAVDQYREIGIQVTPIRQKFTALADRLQTDSSLEGWILGWTLAPEPDPYTIWHSSQIPDPANKKAGFNASRLIAPGLDETIDKARQGPDCSIATRKKHYAEFNRILNDEQPYYFGFASHKLRAVPTSLRNFEAGQFGDLHAVHRWWLAKGAGPP